MNVGFGQYGIGASGANTTREKSMETTAVYKIQPHTNPSLEIPDLPPEIPRPAGKRILLQNIKRPEIKTDSGLVIPQEVSKADEFLSPVSLVVAVGPDAYSDQEVYRNGPWCKPGDYVLHDPYAGQRFEVKLADGTYAGYRFLNDTEIRGITDMPENVRAYSD